MTIWDSTTKTANYLDARETAPSDAHEDMFQSNPDLALFGKPNFLLHCLIFLLHIVVTCKHSVDILI